MRRELRVVASLAQSAACCCVLLMLMRDVAACCCVDCVRRTSCCVRCAALRCVQSYLRCEGYASPLLPLSCLLSFVPVFSSHPFKTSQHISPHLSPPLASSHYPFLPMLRKNALSTSRGHLLYTLEKITESLLMQDNLSSFLLLCPAFIWRNKTRTS